MRWPFRVLVLVAILSTGTGAAPQRRESTPAAARQLSRNDLPETLRVGVSSGGSIVVRTLPIEDYVAGVLVGEAARDSAPAALDALAIAVRTYALRNLSRHGADGFDVCDQTHCQVLRSPRPESEQAARRTAGQILTYRGAIAMVFYSASCGGRTEVPSAVWPGEEDPPYLPSRPDDGCGGDPVWSAELRTSDLGRALLSSGYRGTLRSLRVLSRDGSGRVGRIAVDGLTPSEVTGQDLRMAVGSRIGWQYIKSTSFEMRRLTDGYRFEGHGSGHGVGMCVIGSTRLAARGRTAGEILARYFPGTTIDSLWPVAAPSSVTRAPAAPSQVPVPPPVQSTALASAPAPAVPDDIAARARQELDAFAARMRLELASALEAPSPVVRMRIDASTLEYERATRRPWFTHGTLQNGELHLVPIGPLKESGLLERVVRRELVHAIVDEPLSRRPRWVRDGAALYFGDVARNETMTEIRAVCPTDAELEDPVSPGALSNAYARARACFGRQLASGRPWRDVR